MYLNESSYTRYLGFMAILFAIVCQLHQSLGARTLNGLRIAITIFVINFIAAWWALPQDTDRNRSVAFDIIFYITMILAPGLLLYISVLAFLNVLVRSLLRCLYNMVITLYNFLVRPTTPTNSPPLTPCHGVETDDLSPSDSTIRSGTSLAAYIPPSTDHIEANPVATIGSPNLSFRDRFNPRTLMAFLRSTVTTTTTPKGLVASGHSTFDIEANQVANVAPTTTHHDAETESSSAATDRPTTDKNMFRLVYKFLRRAGT